MKNKLKIGLLAMVAAGIFLMLCTGSSYAAEPGNALSFDGADDYVSFSPIPARS